MAAKRVFVATHGHCFDGMASAVLFTRLLRAVRSDDQLSFEYKSCGYSPNMLSIPEKWLVGDENAILDFRYTVSKKLTWYFDHHVTGFGTEEEEQVAVSDGDRPLEAPGPHVVFDAKYSSCAKLIADSASRAALGANRIGLNGQDGDPMAELVEWADRVDSARFASPDEALDEKNPVMRLASVVEHHADTPFLNRIVPLFDDAPLSEIAVRDDITELYQPISAARQTFVTRVRDSARVYGSVVLVDLADRPVEGVAKFATYALFPNCVYSVTLFRSRQHIKMTIGYNPWSGQPRRHVISKICKRYGGGGHAVVGAASFRIAQVDQAREAAQEVLKELNE